MLNNLPSNASEAIRRDAKALWLDQALSRSATRYQSQGIRLCAEVRRRCPG